MPNIRLYQGEANPADVKLLRPADPILVAEPGTFAIAAADVQLIRRPPSTATIYLYAGEANPSDVKLRVPEQAPGGSTTMVADVGTYTLAGQSAALLVGRVVVATAGTYTLAGQAAGLLVGRKLTAASGTYTLTGQSVTLLHNSVLTAAAGSYSIAGQAATLIYSGGSAPAAPTLDTSFIRRRKRRRTALLAHVTR